MILDDYKHINALHKLLGKIRYSDKLDSDDIDFFATSPLIVEIHEMVIKDWLLLSKEKGYITDSDIDKMVFEFDSFNGQILKNRVDNWDDKMILTIKNWTDSQINDYAILMVSPLKFKQEEIDKLIDYIKNKIG
jgi:hypothetical protein